MSNYQLLGADTPVEVAVPPTYSVDELKNVQAYNNVRTQLSSDPDKYLRYGPGTSQYFLYPFNWTDLPRNYIEDAGSVSVFTKNTQGIFKGLKTLQAITTSGMSLIDAGGVYDKSSTYGIAWKGKAFSFKNPTTYINGLKLVTTPAAYIRYLKLAPLAGFSVSGESHKTQGASRGYKGREFNTDINLDVPVYDEAYNGDFTPELPPEATGLWWKEVITYDLMRHSFFQLRAAQIEDRTDLEAVYMNAGKIIDSLIDNMRSGEPVDVLPRGTQSTGFHIHVKLYEWQITALINGINEVRKLIDESRKKMAMRIIELSDVDAKIVPTSFSTDPLSNPYLVYNQEKSLAAGKPVFVNTARNSSSTWAPPEVAGRPENLQYWQAVPEYTAQHERVYATAEGPMSEADILKYGLDGSKRTNWLPWIAAGAAAAFAAYQLKG